MIAVVTGLVVAASAAMWIPPVGMAADTACIVMGMSVDGRRSPLDSLSFAVDGGTVKVCYGRPAARGRQMIGGRSVPFGRVWRTGANEPTMIHTTIPIAVAGVAVPPGTYSLYTVPGETEWQIIVNRSVSQWGHERNYTADVEAEELGRATVASGTTGEHQEQFTIRAEPGDMGATLILEWERTQVRVPITRR